MNWYFIIGGVVVLLLLIVVAYSFMSDPQEVDTREMTSVKDETAEARRRTVASEKAQEATESQEEKSVYEAGDFTDQ